MILKSCRTLFAACLMAASLCGGALAQDKPAGLFSFITGNAGSNADVASPAPEQTVQTAAAPAVPVVVANASARDSAPVGDTHPPLRLTPDKSELVRLDADASRVIVGNPAHASVLVDSPRLLVVVPLQPGATYFTVLDANGMVIMQRHVIVASPKEKYVRLRKTCAMGEQKNCKDTSVYYCPDMCHEISVDAGDEGGTQPGSSAGGTEGDKSGSESSETQQNQAVTETPQ